MAEKGTRAIALVSLIPAVIVVATIAFGLGGLTGRAALAVCLVVLLAAVILIASALSHSSMSEDDEKAAPAGRKADLTRGWPKGFR